MQVTYHIIATPAANYVDGVNIDSGTEERHGTCGTDQLIGDILGFKALVWAAKLVIIIEGLGDHCGNYIFPPPQWRHNTG